jgi:hypothetical protein
MMPHQAEDSDLKPWDVVVQSIPNDSPLGLMIGNGASMAVWSRYGLRSLYEVACDPSRTPHLEGFDQKVFDQLKSPNFEAILSGLKSAGKIWGAFNKPDRDIGDLRESYKRIRNCLISAVKDVHVPFDRFTENVKYTIAQEFRNYQYVYSTNYDLLAYWSTMHYTDFLESKDEFKDFFWDEDEDNQRVWFDITDTNEWDDPSTKVLYLHGGLHLCKSRGGTFKKVGGVAGNLLDQFNVGSKNVPLFISEGHWEDKTASIANNPYLAFAYSKLERHRGSMVVFGHSLSDSYDYHLVEAMLNWRRYDQKRNRGRQTPRVILISMMPTDPPAKIITEKLRLRQHLGDYYEIDFFNALTHPLGDQTLKLSEDGA